MVTWTMARIAVMVAVVGLAAACAEITPFEYTATDEIQPGPGLLSGEDGEFTLYRR